MYVRARARTAAAVGADVAQGAVVVVVAAVAPHQVNPMAVRAAIHAAVVVGMAGLVQTSFLGAMVTSHPAAKVMSHLVAMLILRRVMMLISHPAMTQTSNRATTHNRPTTRRATSAHVRRKSAIARVAATQAAAWVANAARAHARPPKAVSLIQCAPAWT